MDGRHRMGDRTKNAISAEQAVLLRQIPSVDELLLQPRLAALAKRVDRSLIVEVARAALADLRARIAGEMGGAVLAEIAVLGFDPASLDERISSIVERILARSLQPVINYPFRQWRPPEIRVQDHSGKGS